MSFILCFSPGVKFDALKPYRRNQAKADACEQLLDIRNFELKETGYAWNNKNQK